jgi:type I restriction enzyme M protein
VSASTPEARRLVQKLWSYCDVLRDDGVSSIDYLEQLTFLLFLKMADERVHSRLNPQRIVPAGYDWQALLAEDGRALELTYMEILDELGQGSSTLGVIFRKAQNKIQDPAKLKRLIVDLIDKEQWSSADVDVKGDAYEELLERSAEDVKSGAGQYFTPRALIRAMVDCVQPGPKDTIIDPACGTGGFLLASYEYLTAHHGQELTPEQRTYLGTNAIGGVELVDATARLAQMNLVLHGIGRPDGPQLIEVRDALAAVPRRHASVVLANPPFGRKSSITVIGEEGRATREDIAYERPDFWETTSNKQLNFVQHIASLLAIEGRAAVVVPDNVLFEGGAGEQVRRRLLKQFDVHTLLRLPTGIFYSGGVKANVLFFDKKPASEHPWTKQLWVYDFRTGQHFTLKQNPLRREHLQDFVDCYLPGKDRSERVETERFRLFTYEELVARDKASLDIIWLKDPSLEGSDDLLPPEVIAQEIVEDLEAALSEFAAIAEALQKRPGATTPPETQG